MMVNYGYNEIISYSFVDEKFESRICYKEELLYIKNPLSEKMGVMRYSLLQGLIKTLRMNINRKHDDIHLFEVGNIYKNEDEFNNEIKVISGISTEMDLIKYNFYTKKNYFFVIKKIIENICKKIYGNDIQIFKNYNNILLNKNNSAEIYINKEKIGFFGLLNQNILNYFSIKNKIYFFEIKLSFLKFNEKRYKKISKYPSVRRDLSLLINKNISYYELVSYLYKLNINILKKIKIIDIYEKDEYDINRSITFMFIFQSNKMTLTNKDINKYINIIIYNLNKDFKAILRS